ncbi:cilia- and flagella-associated protein 157-like [Battus philenor]|uniref:cilia- and flagella-associated protein 157-like n=1 Tax=Battus philenor TaxID=42288 RepID=UPI0035CFD783
MAPKKEKTKKDEKGGTFTEVERTFLELELADCNRKLARLRSSVEEYEQRNEELQQAYDTLDEDRADIIAYLKKIINGKNEETSELKEKVAGLEEARRIETAQFKETVAELEKNFIIMKDQLTSENKLLAGKLNTLEEFRAIRDDLMRKFEKQEQDFKDQEMKYKRIIYDAEKKFIVSKDKLKKEMEARLLQLAQDFQDATELRIAASTHRVIRENIAINNELDNILSGQSKLTEQNENFRESERTARISMQLAEEERDKAITKSALQQKVIDQLTLAFQKLNKDKALFDKKTYDCEILQGKVQKLTKENENLSTQIRILEQNLHVKMSDQNKAVVEYSKVTKQNARLKKILKEAATAVQAALKLDQWATDDPSRDVMDRQVLLSRLLAIVTQYREIQRAESLDTLVSFGKIYEEGDLGFIPKPSSKKSVASTAFLQSSRASLGDEKESSTSVVTSSTLGSVKTIPSIKILPPSTVPDVTAKESVTSFMASSQSTLTTSRETVEEEEETDDIEKLLVKSKLEIQKSIMKDLAYSQMALSSQAKFSEQKFAQSKSVIFETKETEEVVEEKSVESDKEIGEDVQVIEEIKELNKEIVEQEPEGAPQVEEADNDEIKE